MTTLLDRFEFDPSTIIGQGGMGKVYLGTDHLTHQSVAVKHLRPDVVQDNPDLVARFQREGEALRDLNHPNIVKMLDAGDHAGEHYIVMEYVGGGSLRDLLDKEPRLTVQRALYIALDLADALTRAHRLSILHRDIKPGNVLLAVDGTPRLTDFGVARVSSSNMTQDGMLVGTMAYLSPESLIGGTLDERHDIWAYGVMLFEMLAGKRPYDHEMIGPLINAITTQPLPDLEAIRPDLPLSLVDLIYRMLDKDPNTRIRSVRMIGAELEAIINGADSRLPVIASDATSARFRKTTPMTPIQIGQNTSEVAAAAVLKNAPTQATPFVGRANEINDLNALITDPNIRLITVMGPGGIGKTRLAIAVAEAAASSFRHGAYYVPLAAVEDPMMVPLKLAEAIGFDFSGGDPYEQLLSYLKDREVLLLMDNLEHLSKGAERIASALERLPHVTIMTTSRERLRLRGEQVYELDNMLVPPGDLDDPTQLMQYPAVELFVNTATRTAPHFELNADTVHCVAHIIRQVQGMPLAIELAAGWLEMLDVSEIAEEIEKSIDFLETDMRDVPERHRSMRAVFDYSWNLMTEDERDAFMKLSLFRGGFDRGAVQQVVGTSLRTLTALVNKSVLFRDANGRYAISKLLRQYAEERFDAHCTAALDVRRKYVEHYTEVLSAVENYFNTRSEEATALLIETEMENIRHAWTLALDMEMNDALLRIVPALMTYHIFRSGLLEGRARMFDLLGHLEQRGDTQSELYWQARLSLALTQQRLGEYIHSHDAITGVVAHYRATNNADKLGEALSIQCYALMMLGRYDESREVAHESIMVNKQTQNRLWLAQSQGNLGYLEFLAGNLQTAREIYEELTQTTYTMDNSPIGYAYGRNNLGEIYHALGDIDAALLLYQEAHEVFKRYRNKRGMAFTMNNVGGVRSFQGDYTAAEDCYRQAHNIYKAIGDRAGIGHSLSAMGNIAMFKGDYAEALANYQRALELRREIGDRAGIGNNLSEIGMMLYLLNRGGEARPYYEEAVEIADQLNNPMIRSRAYVGMGGVLLWENKPEEAMPYLQTALRVAANDVGFNEGVTYIAAAVATILAGRGWDEKAAQLIGYVDQFDAAIVKPMVGPLLENIRYELKHRMGSAFTTAYQVGQGATPETVIETVLTA